jgi:hypothetical protein
MFALPIALLWLCPAIRAQGPGRCGEPALSERIANFVIVDANTGRPLEGSTRFLEGDRVQVIIRNKNPYKYSYRFDATANPLQASIVSDFIGTLGPIFKEKLPAYHQTLRLTNEELTTSYVGGGTPCSSDDLKDATEQINAFQRKIDDIKTEYERQKGILDGYIRQYDAFLLATDADRIDCDSASVSASRLIPTLDELTHLTASKERLEQLRGLSGDLDRLGSNLMKQIEKAPQECRDFVHEQLDAQHREVQVHIATIDGYLKDLESRRQQFDDLARIIYNAQSSGSFTEVLYPYTDGKPSAIEVDLYRRNIRARDAQETRVGSVQLILGESRSLSVSAGFGFSSLREVSYLRQNGLVADTLGTVFGYKYNSAFSPSMLLCLNFHAGHWSWFGEKDMSAGLSLGYVLGSNFLQGDGQYMLGLTIGAVNDYLLLTFGAHAARVDQLSGGFKVGDPVPSGLPDPLPVQRDYKLGFMFAVTGRIR